jgi:hypothetical protein
MDVGSPSQTRRVHHFMDAWSLIAMSYFPAEISKMSP